MMIDDDGSPLGKSGDDARRRGTTYDDDGPRSTPFAAVPHTRAHLGSFTRATRSMVFVEHEPRRALQSACEVLGVLIHGETERASSVVAPGAEGEDGKASVEVVDGEAEKYAKALMAKSDAEVLGALIEAAPTLFSDGGDKETAGVVHVMANLAREDEGSMKRVMECVTASASERVELRMRCAISVYNDAKAGAGKFGLFEAIAAYAKEAKRQDVLPTLVAHASANVTAWGEDAATQRRVLALCIKLLKDLESTDEELFACMIKYLATFEGDAGSVAEAADIAKEAAFAFINSPTMFEGDFLELKAVQDLQKSNQGVFKLLSTLLTGSVSDYNALIKSDGKLISGLGLSESDCLAKMRSMALSTLGKKGEVTYAEVKEALQCEAGEVEELIVRAVGASVVDAKMDQAKQLVVFTRCTDRVFGGEQWKELSSKISTWRAQIAHMEKALSTK